MSNKHKLFNRIGAAFLAGGIAVGAANVTQAGVIQLGFVLDDSGSVGASNYTTIKNGLANAIKTIVPVGSLYEISVVAFSTNATAVVTRHLIVDNQDRLDVAAAIVADPFDNGGTDLAEAFDLMSTILQGSGLMIDNTYVNLATDGDPNNESDAITARNNLIADAGVDNISIEAIGSNLNASFLQDSICYPNASGCDTTSPFDFPNSGFYIAVADADEYAVAIRNKIAIVTDQDLDIPEPGTLAVLAFGLAGFGLTRRRKAA